MRLAIMQPYFFPYIGYFQLIHSVDKFMLYENVSFRKKSWMTRNYIQQKNEVPLMISIPTCEKSSLKNIYEIKLTDNKLWKQWFYKTIYFYYKKACFFEETFPLIEEILVYECDTLHEFNCCSIIRICTHLDIKTEISTNHESYLGMEHELQEKYNEESNKNNDNNTEKKIIRIINICKNEHAKIYHNAINGINLYKKENFSLYGINLKFIKQEITGYKQFNDSFTPNLSIIDVLMHCGKEGTKRLLKEYNII